MRTTHAPRRSATRRNAGAAAMLVVLLFPPIFAPDGEGLRSLLASPGNPPASSGPGQKTGSTRSAGSEKTPDPFFALWRDYDPRREPLETKVVRTWRQDKIELRYVVYTVGTFKGVKSRVAAFYGFPAAAKGKLPGLVQLHGGGQRASLTEVLYYAARGYACLSVNWGGREMEGARPGEAGTDWGAVDPTQKNVPGYFNFKPGPKHPDPEVSARNNNWYLLTLAARRGLTFLERQKEVDPARLGVYGHSMGGNLTIYVAGTDARVKAAAPSVGGSGFRSLPRPLLPGWRPRTFGGHEDLYRKTMAFEAYAPHVKAPLLWLGASNDFHGIMDDTYRTGALIPHGAVRYSFTPHMNHRFTPAFAVARPLWLDQHLKAGPALAATPDTALELKTDDRVPRLVVRPDLSQPPSRVAVYYSDDPDPRARFWRSAEARRTGKQWTAALPLLDTRQPLFAFANVHYALDKPQALPHDKAESYALSSLLHTATPADLAAAGTRATDKQSLLIDDFAHAWRDWYVLQPGNPHHWQYWTRKITDPKYQGPPGAALVLEVQSAKPNKLVVVLEENEWRNYRGKRRTYAAVVALQGGRAPQTVTLRLADFTDPADKTPPAKWTHLDQLGFVAYFLPSKKDRTEKLGGTWQGPPPVFHSLRWEVGQQRQAPKSEDG